MRALSAIQTSMSTLSGTPATSNAASRPLSMKPSTGGNARALRLLIRFGADLRIKDHCGRTPLALAIEISKLELAEMLVRNSANGNHNIRDSFGHSPAALARKKGYNELASSILRLSTRAPSPIESSSMNSSLISTPEASFLDASLPEPMILVRESTLRDSESFDSDLHLEN